MRMKPVPLYILSCIFIFAMPASAGTDLEEGTKLYQAKDYVKAKPYFESAIKANPMGWHGHYYLANCYLALGKMAQARYEYEACKKLSTNPTIQAQCQAGIERTSKYSASATSSRAAATKASEASDDGDADEVKSKPTGNTDAQNLAAKRKEEIMKEARAQVAKIKQEAKEQLEHEKSSSNQFYRTEDGHVGTDISDERESEIQRECEAKCRKVMEDAERKVRSIR